MARIRRLRPFAVRAIDAFNRKKMINAFVVTLRTASRSVAPPELPVPPSVLVPNLCLNFRFSTVGRSAIGAPGHEQLMTSAHSACITLSTRWTRSIPCNNMFPTTLVLGCFFSFSFFFSSSFLFLMLFSFFSCSYFKRIRETLPKKVQTTDAWT